MANKKKENKVEIEYKGVNYALVFNLNVMIFQFYIPFIFNEIIKCALFCISLLLHNTTNLYQSNYRK